MAFFRRQCLAHLLSYWKRHIYEESNRSAFEQQNWLYHDFDAQFSSFTKALYGWADGQNLGEDNLNSYQKNLFYYNSPHHRATEEMKKKNGI